MSIGDIGKPSPTPSVDRNADPNRRKAQAKTKGGVSGDKEKTPSNLQPTLDVAKQAESNNNLPEPSQDTITASTDSEAFQTALEQAQQAIANKDAEPSQSDIAVSTDSEFLQATLQHAQQFVQDQQQNSVEQTEQTSQNEQQEGQQTPFDKHSQPAKTNEKQPELGDDHDR